MGSVSVYMPVLYHQYVVRMLHTGYALGNDDFGGSRHVLRQAIPYPGLRGRIHCTGAVIQYQDFGPLKQGPGNTEPLLLAAGDVVAALLDVGLVLVGEALDKFIGAGLLAGV